MTVKIGIGVVVSQRSVALYVHAVVLSEVERNQGAELERRVMGTPYNEQRDAGSMAQQVTFAAKRTLNVYGKEFLDSSGFHCLQLVIISPVRCLSPGYHVTEALRDRLPNI